MVGNMFVPAGPVITPRTLIGLGPLQVLLPYGIDARGFPLVEYILVNRIPPVFAFDLTGFAEAVNLLGQPATTPKLYPDFIFALSL